MRYYVYVSKMVDLVADEQIEDTLEFLKEKLEHPVENIHEGFMELFGEKMKTQVKEHLRDSPHIGLSHIYDKHGELIFTDMTVMVYGAGEDAQGNVTFVTALGIVTIMP